MLPLTIEPIGSRNAPYSRGEMSPILYAGWNVTFAFLPMMYLRFIVCYIYFIRSGFENRSRSARFRLWTGQCSHGRRQLEPVSRSLR
jgi:hypothetical protein